MDFLQRGEKSCRLNLNEVAAAAAVEPEAHGTGWLDGGERAKSGNKRVE